MTEETTPTPEEKKETLVTEKPVPSVPAKKTSQYVVTVDNETGLAVKIEKLDEGTGEHKELSKEEYTAVFAYASLAAPYYAGYSAYAPTYSPESASVVQAYYRGVADYLKGSLLLGECSQSPRSNRTFSE